MQRRWHAQARLYSLRYLTRRYDNGSWLRRNTEAAVKYRYTHLNENIVKAFNYLRDRVYMASGKNTYVK